MTDANLLIPAAQYLRMSTEHQKYSPENQSTAISEIRRTSRIHGSSDILRSCQERALAQEPARTTGLAAGRDWRQHRIQSHPRL
jgi:hypothetical protein